METVRPQLTGREQALFDFLCAAGQLGYRLPDGDIKLRAAAGTKDPRRRLVREFPGLLNGSGTVPRATSLAWSRASERLTRVLVKKLARTKLAEEERALRILLAYATIALAPDCIVPRDPVSRAAWDTALNLFAQLFPSKVRSLGALDCVHRRLPALRREVAAGLRKGRIASGKTPGPQGRELAVDPALIALVEKAIGKELVPGYMARFLFYTKPGDHIWPHPDDPQWAVTVLICIRHDLPPGGGTGSAFLGYHRDGSVKRYEIPPGSALAVEPGLIHAREPVQDGERVALLSIGLCAPDQTKRLES